ncbi:NADase-type glycan-binding domain-containing protein [Nocardia lijiangensis]|uniref:NADase-type glycan-binding domain-containing protein n=1 Tax=Nocardia lijiangensis TaxID=299618 RepID=UPI003D712440
MKAVLNIFTLLLAAVVGAVGVQIADNIPRFWTAISSVWRAPNCENPKGLRLVQGEATTSSVLPSTETPRGTFRYDAKNVLDNDSGTAWVEGVPGWGIGQQLTIQLPQTLDVRLVCVVNGLPLDDNLYRRNGRVKSFDVRTDRGERLDSRLTDEAIDVPQAIEIPPGPTARIELTVREVYVGKGQDRFDDTAVAEVLVYAAA